MHAKDRKHPWLVTVQGRMSQVMAKTPGAAARKVLKRCTVAQLVRHKETRRLVHDKNIKRLTMADASVSPLDGWQEATIAIDVLRKVPQPERIL